MNNQKKIYKSKIDVWLAAALTGGVAVLFYIAGMTLMSGGPMVRLQGLIVVAALALTLWVLLGTRYIMEADRLLIRSGPFKWTIPLAEIRAIKPTNNPVASPALSLQRLRIDYGKGQVVLISPRNRTEFMRELEGLRRRANHDCTRARSLSR
ncbi:MAG TPA: PH domain-containing protein [Wenzhouxiangella sp.]|nr:PH domain-containing protein [Wenzhouxiangella sp.]